MIATPGHIAGEVRVQSWRRVWVARSAGPLTCSAGHRFKDDALVWAHGCLRCRHRASRESPGECGRLVYLVGGGLVTPRGEPLVILAEVTAEEMREMSDRKMDYDHAMTYLGIQFPG
jgi:hypothetical protein